MFMLMWSILSPVSSCCNDQPKVSKRSVKPLSKCALHATRAYLPSHLTCIIHFLNEIKLVLYVGGHRKKLYNQTLENF